MVFFSQSSTLMIDYPLIRISRSSGLNLHLTYWVDPDWPGNEGALIVRSVVIYIGGISEWNPSLRE